MGCSYCVDKFNYVKGAIIRSFLDAQNYNFQKVRNKGNGAFYVPKTFNDVQEVAEWFYCLTRFEK